LMYIRTPPARKEFSCCCRRAGFPATRMVACTCMLCHQSDDDKSIGRLAQASDGAVYRHDSAICRRGQVTWMASGACRGHLGLNQPIANLWTTLKIKFVQWIPNCLDWNFFRICQSCVIYHISQCWYKKEDFTCLKAFFYVTTVQ
jgi:hypothetical protein